MLQDLAPPFLKTGEGDAWLGTYGKALDNARQYTLDAIRNRFPSLASPDALPHIGSTCNLEKPENLTDDEFRAMLSEVWPIWLASGTQAGLINEVKRLGFTGPVTVIPVYNEIRTEDGINFNINFNYATPEPEQNRNFQLQLEGRKVAGLTVYGPYTQQKEWDTVTVNICYTEIGLCISQVLPYWDFFNYIWSSYYLVIGLPHDYTFWKLNKDRKWGEPGVKWNGVKTGSQVMLDRLFKTIDTFGAAHTTCRAILFEATTSQRRTKQVVQTFMDGNGEWAQLISTVVINAFSPAVLWNGFNFGAGPLFANGFHSVRKYEAWERDEMNPPNIKDIW